MFMEVYDEELKKDLLADFSRESDFRCDSAEPRAKQNHRHHMESLTNSYVC